MSSSWLRAGDAAHHRLDLLHARNEFARSAPARNAATDRSGSVTHLTYPFKKPCPSVPVAPPASMGCQRFCAAYSHRGGAALFSPASRLTLRGPRRGQRPNRISRSRPSAGPRLCGPHSKSGAGGTHLPFTSRWRFTPSVRHPLRRNSVCFQQTLAAHCLSRSERSLLQKTEQQT